MCPEVVETSQPTVDVLKLVPLQRVVALAALSTLADDTDLQHQSKVLGYRGPADWEGRGEIRHTMFARRQVFEQRPAQRVRDHAEYVIDNRGTRARHICHTR